MKKNLKEKIYYSRYLILLLLVMFIVYACSMFCNRPWYDELYTYYYFISRGPVYAAIHWPVPNNHMGYSVLSAVLDLFGNNYIGLRGVSVICSVANVYLLYRLCKRLCPKQFFTVMGVYLGSYLTYSLAFQGRGYALTTTCLLLALNALADIAFGEEKKTYYIIWICALTWGLYTIASSTYWVIPLCLTGGAYLLITKQYKKLIRLIASSLLAAILTMGMYSMVWLAIGSNLLSKDAGSVFFGMYQLDVIKASPFKALRTGMQYMLDTPYIQSIDRGDVITGLWGYFVSLFDQFYSYLHIYMGTVTNAVFILSVIIALIKIVGYMMSAKEESDNKSLMTAVIVAVFGISIPLMLIIQSVNPYLRVFSFFAVILGIMAFYLINNAIIFLSELFKRDDRVYEMAQTGIGICIMFVAITSNLLFTFKIGNTNSYYPIQLADRENDIADVLSVMDGDPHDIDSIYYTDDFQRFVLKFYYDIEPVETSFEEAKYVIISTAFLENTEQSDWPMLVYSDSFDIDYLTCNFELKGETKAYRVYRRK